MKLKAASDSRFIYRSLGAKKLGAALSEESLNIEVSPLGIASRPGMSLTANPVIYSPEEFADGFIEFALTDFFLELRGRRAQIALAVEDDQKSNIYYHFYAVYSDCTKDKLGTITFSRVDSYTFGVPVSYTIFSGQPTSGGGIYFIARLTYGNAIPDETCVYEINSDLNGWLRLIDSNLYTPTLLINGRGDSVGKAILEGELKLSEPRQLEPQNLLCPNCFFYYTSDGYSSSFTLPDHRFEGYGVECTVTQIDGSVRQFYIAQGEILSGESDINGKGAVMRLDRGLNRICFETAAGDALPIPFTAAENNIKFFVTPRNEDDSLMLSSMCRSASFTAKSNGGGSAVILLYGSRLYPDTFVWCDAERPLYFPKSCTLTLASPQGAIGKMLEADGRLLIFKQDMLFSAGFTAPDGYSLSGIVGGVAASGEVKFPKYSEVGRIALPAKVIPSTVKSCAGRVYFCTEDKKLRCVTPGLSERTVLTLPEKPELAVIFNGRCLVSASDEVFVTAEDEASLLRWRLPARPENAVFFGDSTVFFASTENGAIYGFDLNGHRDSYLKRDEYDLVEEEIEAKAALCIAEEDRVCRLSSISVTRSSPFCSTLRLRDGDKPLAESLLTEDGADHHIPALFRRLYVELQTQGASRITDISLKYSRLGRL